MIALWIGAALLSALAASFIIYRSARAAAAAEQPGEDPALAVYRRQLSEIDDLAERGLLPEGEHRSAHTEAARRLLAAADRAAPAPASSRPARWMVAAAAAAAPLVAAGLYLTVGSPKTPDQPFAKRLDEWRQAATTDPSSLSPAQFAAILPQIVAQHPNDPAPLMMLAQVQAASGDAFSAERNLRKAAALAPTVAEPWDHLGELLATQPGGEVSPGALDAFTHAAALDPTDPESHYFLGRAKIAGGDAAGGLVLWRAVLAEFKPDDQRRSILAQQIAVVEKTHALPAPEPDAATASAQGDQQAFIHSMVDRLAARLQNQPDDPPGWARLVRAYGVLGDKPHQAAALARARDLFKNRPNDLAPIEAAAQ